VPYTSRWSFLHLFDFAIFRTFRDSKLWDFDLKVSESGIVEAICQALTVKNAFATVTNMFCSFVEIISPGNNFKQFCEQLFGSDYIYIYMTLIYYCNMHVKINKLMTKCYDIRSKWAKYLLLVLNHWVTAHTGDLQRVLASFDTISDFGSQGAIWLYFATFTGGEVRKTLFEGLKQKFCQRSFEPDDFQIPERHLTSF